MPRRPGRGRAARVGDPAREAGLAEDQTLWLLHGEVPFGRALASRVKRPSGRAAGVGSLRSAGGGAAQGWQGAQSWHGFVTKLCALVGYPPPGGGGRRAALMARLGGWSASPGVGLSSLAWLGGGAYSAARASSADASSAGHPPRGVIREPAPFMPSVARSAPRGQSYTPYQLTRGRRRLACPARVRGPSAPAAANCCRCRGQQRRDGTTPARFGS